MSAPSSFFSGYRQRRLQDLAARFSQAPAEAWDGHEALPALFHEQLTLGTRFALPLLVSARFSPESAASAAEILNLVSRDAVLTSLDADFDDPDYLTVWELIENASLSLSLLAPVTALGSEAADISVRLADEMKRMPGSDPSTPYNTLSTTLEVALKEWSVQAPFCSPHEARAIFLGLLYRHVLSAFPSPANFWEIFLLKLELAIASTSASPALVSLLAPAFRVAWSALPIQAALYAFWTIHSESTGADAIVAERITTLAVLARAGGPSSGVLRLAITPEWVAATPASHAADADAPWRATISQHLELAAYHPLFEASEHWRRLVAATTEIPAALTSRLAALRKISDDLSQGMAGKDTSDLYVSLATELLARGLWISTLTTNPTEARELYLQPAVRELGLNATSTLWKKISRLSSGLQQFISTLPATLPWANLPPLLRALESRASDTNSLPVRWSQPVPQQAFAGLPFAAAAGSARCARDVSRLLSRLTIEQRIHGAQRGGVELARWYASKVLPHLTHLPDEAFRERWDLLAETGFSPLEEHADLNTAARKLELHAENFATTIADEVIANLPEYADRIGAVGRIACIRDGVLTLSQVANLLLSDTESQQEALSEWWGSTVGGYIATRPARLFEVNLAAIFHTLSRNLTASEVSAAFSPIQILYRESLGIECLEALTGPPTAITGPLARRLTADFFAPEPNRESFADALRAILVEKNATDPATHQTLLSAFFTYHQEYWTSGDADIAAARVMPLFAATEIAKHRSAAISAILICATNPSATSDRDALLLAESADGFVLALAQHGVATKLVEQAHEIAMAYSAAMVTHAPDHFKHLSDKDAIARCTRDQTLLLKSLGERLARTSPCLYWIDSTRWFLELLSPFIEYPVHVWALSARTVAKHLGPQLSAVENLFLSRWVSHFEHLALGWSSSHALAKMAFTPTDYSFSAHVEDDRIQRDLLAAALTARFAPAAGPWCGDALFHRFLLSWPAATRTTEEINSILANITQVAGTAMPHGVAAWLERTPAAISALIAAEGPHPAARYALATGLPAPRENARALSLFLADGPELEIWRHVRANYEPGPDLALAKAAVRAHLLHNDEDKRTRALASRFPAAARARCGLVSAALEASFDASVWTQLGDSLMAHSADPNALRSHFTTLALQWPTVQAGIALSHAAAAHADELIGGLAAGTDVTYSQQAPECSTQTNSLAFGYAFRQAGTSAWDESSEPPRLFFGYAADNHRSLPTLVASRAHTRVNAALRKLLPAGSGLAGQAILGIEAPLFSATGPLWRTLALDARSQSPAYVGALFPAIRPIAQDASAYAFPNGDPRRAVFADRLCYHLEALVCGLEESGDIESAWELLLLRLSADLEHQSATDLISAFYGLTRDLSKHLPPGPAIFWRTCFLGTLEVVRQAALGHHLLINSAKMAEIAAAAAVPGDAELRARCARDQEHLLALLGHLLVTQAPVRAWLNFTSHLTETTLAHLSHGALELAAIWCRHEHTLSSQLDPALHPALWTWLGALQRTSRNLPAVRPFASEVVPELSANLARQHGDNPADWRRFLSALAAAAATPDDGPAPGQALLEKALLSSPLARSHAPREWAALSESIANTCERLLPGNMPNSLKRRLLAIPGIAARLDALTAGKGSRLVRACAAQASHPFSQPLWQASLLARSRPDDRLVESDPADALVSSALGLTLEPDEQILATFTSVCAALGAAASLPLAQPKSGGFLSKLGLGKKAFDWANSPGLRSESNYVLEILSLRAALSWNDPSYLWYWNCPRTLGAHDPDKEAGTLEFYQALSVAASAHFGATHLGAMELAAFASGASARLVGLKLIVPGKSMAGPLPLYLLGLRGPSDIPAYAHVTPHSPDAIGKLLEQARERGNPLNEGQADLVRRAHDEIGRMSPKNN